MKRLQHVLMLSLMASIPLQAQEGPSFGGITAQSIRLNRDMPPVVLCQLLRADTGRPVPGAQVFLHGTQIGALSDEFGMIALRVPDAGTWTLGVRLIGYHEERLELALARATVTQVLVGLRQDGTVVVDSIYLAPPWYEPIAPRDTVKVEGVS